MGIKDRAVSGKIIRPKCILVYGVDGVGKSSFAAEAPKPVFMGPESGTDQMDVDRLPTPEGGPSWNSIQKDTDDLLTDDHDWKTLVVDTVDWIEPLIHKHICDEQSAKSIELASGGFGKGYIEATNQLVTWLGKLTQLRDKRKMNIILLGHCEMFTFNDPLNQTSYQRFQLKLHKRASEKLREWVDAVLFASFKTYTLKEGTVTKAFSDGSVRFLGTERTQGYDAKNRYGLPKELPLAPGESWKTFSAACEAGKPDKPEAIRARIEGLLSQMTDLTKKEQVQKFVKEAGDDAHKLTAAEKKVAMLVGAA